MSESLRLSRSRRAKEALDRFLGVAIRRTQSFPFLTAQRRFLTVRMDLHNRCNLRCSMCFFSLDEMRRTPKVEMSEALIEKIIREVWPMTRELWLSCATEPLIGRHLESVLPRAKPSGIPSLRMVTNGLALDERRARMILDAGLDGLDVSVDGATPQTYELIRRGSSFEKVVGNLQRLREMKRERGVTKPAVNMITVMMPENLNEWADLVHLAADVGAATLALVPLVEIAELPRGQHLAAYPGEVNAALVKTHEEARRRNITLIAPEPFATTGGDAGPDSNASVGPGARRCFVPWTEIVIYSDGEVVPCPAMFGKRRFGNLKEEPFRKIYYGEALRRLREEHRSGALSPICEKCAGIVRDTLNDPAIFETRSAFPQREAEARGGAGIQPDR